MNTNTNTNTTNTETAQERQDRENWETCKRIAKEVEAVTAGRVYRCPDCGELVALEEGENVPERCPCCGADMEDADQVGLLDYFSDALDVEYTIGSDRSFRSVRIMVACGGPNIYVNTCAHAVQLYWWTDRAEYPLDADTVDAINYEFEELYNCM